MEYWQLRAIELVDPRSYFGKPWCDLTYKQQIDLLAYAILRMEEKAPEDDE